MTFFEDIKWGAKESWNEPVTWGRLVCLVWTMVIVKWLLG